MKKPKLKLHPNACPKCGQLFKRISGLWRCQDCGINKKYDLDDGRPRSFGRIEPLIAED